VNRRNVRPRDDLRLATAARKFHAIRVQYEVVVRREAAKAATDDKESCRNSREQQTAPFTSCKARSDHRTDHEQGESAHDKERPLTRPDFLEANIRF
jgi:hypothetical protein